MKEKKMLNKVIENILGDDYSTNKKFSKLSPEIQKEVMLQFTEDYLQKLDKMEKLKKKLNYDNRKR